MKRERVWEMQKSLSVFQNPKNTLEQLQNGRPPGDEPQKQSPSHSPIVEMNYLTMGTTLKKSLQPKYHHPITGSSCTISHSEMKSAPQTTTFNPPENQTFATSSTTEPANLMNPIAGIDTYAKTVRNQDIPARIAHDGAEEIYGVQPKYLRHNLWEELSVLSPTTAEWSLHAPSLPLTPINVNVFISLLVNHPNQPFVRSGFWPWTDTLCDNFPATHDKSRPDPFNPKKSKFILEQCKIKIDKVEKPNSTDLQLVTDHSAGLFSLNSMIDHTKKSIGNIPITMWKSDIAKAYCLMPVHPCWQIKQINTIGSRQFVDHNLAFGSSNDLLGCDVTGNTLYYAPYNCYLPSHQKQLLNLWDELGIPHKPHKQLSGSPLMIIGINVNPKSMTLSLPPSSKSRLLNELSFWSSKPPKRSSSNDFLWALYHIEKSDGVHLLKSTFWPPNEANFTIFCDACPEGMGFWYPDNKTGFYAPTPINVPLDFIFYFELLCVLSALNHVQSHASNGSQIVIYTDNLNTVDMFHSYQALSAYNHILKMPLWVLHVPGSKNIITDALSQVKFSIAFLHKPLLNLYTFNPPNLVGLHL
ncbi:hypothetical protein BYT27DRAFT_7219957 [Phlegmacium glaucopus]|nr:hypothetical protein BYT27DRAFT_7219957 [Phlegmacium glaucopus]